MRKFYLFFLFSCLVVFAHAAEIPKGILIPGFPIHSTELKGGERHVYSISLKKGNRYVFSAMQNGIDVVLSLLDERGKKLAEKDSPNGKNGVELLKYSPLASGNYVLQVEALDDTLNSAEGKYDLYAAEQNKKLVKQLVREDQKNVQTLDIDHFWEAYDNLKKCHTLRDSIFSFQRLYIDRATEGFEDFIKVRGFTSGEYVRVIKQYPKYFRSIRANTLAAKDATPLIEEVFSNFKRLYPNFKPVKVNFSIGALRTAGTVSDRFVLIGSEMSTATEKVDFSEIKNAALGKLLVTHGDIPQKLKNIVAHESVHTQQSSTTDAAAERCNLLYPVLLEGISDFVGEKVAGGQINAATHAYANQHEKELWQEFASNPCDGKVENWLYNFSTVKDRPADLGYYLGYKIAESYYNNRADKVRALTEIIEMNDPKKFLEASGYADKFK